MTRENYPNPGDYVHLWRNAKRLPDNHYDLKADLHGWGHDGRTIKRRFREAVHRRINIRGGLDMRGRRYHPAYQNNLFHDQCALHDKLQRRVRIYQFLTDIVRKRFRHLLDDRSER